MADLVTMEQVRAQLRVDVGTDDALIESLVAAAERAVEIATERTIADGPNGFGVNDRKMAAMAVLLLVTTWYDNRDGLGSSQATAELPHAVTWLLWPLKRLTV